MEVLCGKDELGDTLLAPAGVLLRGREGPLDEVLRMRVPPNDVLLLDVPFRNGVLVMLDTTVALRKWSPPEGVLVL